MTRFETLTLAAFLAAATATAAVASAKPGEFFFSPVPRWQEEPETEDVCAAIRQECPSMMTSSDINADFGFDELYDASGSLVGLRMTRSTGCAPIDESTLLGQRQFKLAFHKPGVPDLDNTRMELANGVNPDDVRIVKASGTSLGLGCGE
jgi:hypothetical protein